MGSVFKDTGAFTFNLFDLEPCLQKTFYFSGAFLFLLVMRQSGGGGEEVRRKSGRRCQGDEWGEMIGGGERREKGRKREI